MSVGRVFSLSEVESSSSCHRPVTLFYLTLQVGIHSRPIELEASPKGSSISPKMPCRDMSMRPIEDLLLDVLVVQDHYPFFLFL